MNVKENELRIGNYITLNGKTERVTGLTPQGDVFIESDSIPVDIKEIEPKQIIAEWLIKVGFKLIDTVNMGFIKYLPKYTHTKDFLYVNTKSYTTCIGNEDKKYECFIENIQYVHRLQNLWLELSGEELDAEPARTTQTIN